MFLKKYNLIFSFIMVQFIPFNNQCSSNREDVEKTKEAIQKGWHRAGIAGAMAHVADLVSMIFMPNYRTSSSTYRKAFTKVGNTGRNLWITSLLLSFSDSLALMLRAIEGIEENKRAKELYRIGAIAAEVPPYFAYEAPAEFIHKHKQEE
jgi:hypothetical protein